MSSWHSHAEINSAGRFEGPDGDQLWKPRLGVQVSLKVSLSKCHLKCLKVSLQVPSLEICLHRQDLCHCDLAESAGALVTADFCETFLNLFLLSLYSISLLFTLSFSIYLYLSLSFSIILYLYLSLLSLFSAFVQSGLGQSHRLKRLRRIRCRVPSWSSAST